LPAHHIFHPPILAEGVNLSLVSDS
jgi:hypothetical protein